MKTKEYRDIDKKKVFWGLKEMKCVKTTLLDEITSELLNKVK